jgi:hypothetical protein
LKKSRFVNAFLVFLLGFFVASVGYKSFLGFYHFKKVTSLKIVPRELSAPEGFEIPTQSQSAVKLSDLKRSKIESFRQWLDLNTGLALLIEIAYGDWQTFQAEYPTDKCMMDAITRKALPSYFRRDSLSMRDPVAFYILPLFPPAKNYRKEYALLAIKGVLPNDKVPCQIAESGSHFFYAFQGKKLVEIVYGDKESGKLMEAVFITNRTDIVITKELIADVCRQIEDAEQTNLKP